METKTLKQAVRSDIERFPQDFMLELTAEELQNWRSQFVTSHAKKMGLRYSPKAFTEQGVAMLPSVLRSKRTIQVNIQIMRALNTQMNNLNPFSTILNRTWLSAKSLGKGMLRIPRDKQSVPLQTICPIIAAWESFSLTQRMMESPLAFRLPMNSCVRYPTLGPMATFCRPGITDYRNPNLADAMRVMGFVQRFGIGIQTARMELKQNGNPDLKITNRGTWSSTPCDYTGDRPPGDIPGRSGTEGFVRAKKARTF